MSKPAYFVAPWDLSVSLPCVPDDPADGTVVLVESVAKGKALPYHKKKLVLVLSAMHHFAARLEAEGYDVEIVNAPTYVDGIRQHVRERGATKVVAMEPREWGLSRALDRAEEEDTFGVPLERHDDGGEGSHFFLTRAEFAKWVKGKKQLRMADFYRFMRKRYGYLLDAKGNPVGGKWSLDAENRQHAKGVEPPRATAYEPDAMTRRIMERVAKWKHRFGEVDGFDWPVTREDALAQLDDFFTGRAADFGRYQDAMLTGQPFMWHALLSPAINLSLVSPREVCDRIVEAYEAGRMPLASAEGLLRQILGWREFIRGVYWHQMPGLRTDNLLGAKRDLPGFFWAPEQTEMRCLRESIGQVERHGYAHHIQRLMVQGNFAMLAGIDPLQISHWFWAAFVDAYEWVELPNVHGMAVYANDAFTTKPYAASGNYIHKMSDYCGGCRYDVKQRTGEDACPFNALFWHFLDRHRERFEANHRLRVLYGNWDRNDESEKGRILATAQRFLDGLEPPPEPWSFEDDAG